MILKSYTPRPTKPTKWTDFYLTAIILTCGIIFTSKIQKFLDISLYDESSYLQRGVNILNNIPAAEYSPLYSFWYYILSKISNTSIDLFYLNNTILIITLPLVFFFALRCYGVTQAAAFIIAVLLLNSSFNLETMPKISNFTAIVIFIGLITSNLTKNNFTRHLVLTLISLLASYIRPEFFISFILLALLVLSQFHQVTQLVKLGFFMIPCLLIIIKFGIPPASGNRSLVAFGQHYAQNWVDWHKNTLNPWTNWESIFQNDFGDAQSLWSALYNNPLAFLRHIISNLVNFLNKFINFFKIYPQNNTTRYISLICVTITIITSSVHDKTQNLRTQENFTGFDLTTIHAIGWTPKKYPE